MKASSIQHQVANVSAGDFQVEGMACSATAIEIPEDLLIERWEAALRGLRTVEQGSRWWIGDLLIHAGKRYGHTYDDALAATGLRRSTLKNCKWVASKFRPDARRADVPWSAHKAVASLPEEARADWLARAAAEGWTTNDLERELRGEKTKLVALADLKPHPRNYRSHSAEQIEHIAESIRTHGVIRPVVTANDLTILAGHGLAEAAKLASLAEVPVLRLPLDPDDPEALKLLTGDNELGLTAKDDHRQLAELLKEVQEGDDLLGTGYDGSQLANLVHVTRPKGEIADFDAAAAWVGLPGYEEMELPHRVVVSCETEADRDDLLQRLGSPAVHNKVDRTWSVWWPDRPKDDVKALRFEEVGDV